MIVINSGYMIYDIYDGSMICNIWWMYNGYMMLYMLYNDSGYMIYIYIYMMDTLGL